MAGFKDFERDFVSIPRRARSSSLVREEFVIARFLLNWVHGEASKINDGRSERTHMSNMLNLSILYAGMHELCAVHGLEMVTRDDEGRVLPVVPALPGSDDALWRDGVRMGVMLRPTVQGHLDWLVNERQKTKDQVINSGIGILATMAAAKGMRPYLAEPGSGQYEAVDVSAQYTGQMKALDWDF